MLDNYKERIKRLSLFDPLSSLGNKSKKDLSDKKMDMYGIGLMVLLFFYECKLIRKREVGLEEVTEFLQKSIGDQYEVDGKLCESIGLEIIRTYRPASGKRLSKAFFNWETKKEDVVYLSILKAGKSDISSNKQYYELDEDGLDLIFMTKEYHSEFQLSINQMLLRKQLEKGEFGSALRQTDEMKINVESLRDRIEKIKREINRNIVSNEVFDRYKKLVEDIYERLTFESREFNELKNFLNGVLGDLRFKRNSESDERIYGSALKVAKALREVHEMHDLLLEQCIMIETNALDAAKESLYYSGVESFNFNKELVSYSITEGVSLEKVRNLVKPFTSLNNDVTWSPLALFFPQRVVNKSDVQISKQFLTLEDEAEENKYIEIFYKGIMNLCIQYMGDAKVFKLSDFIEHLKTSHPDLLNHKQFYMFFMALHQLSPIKIQHSDGDGTHNLIVEAIKLFHNRYQSLRVVETKDVIKVGNVKISNMILELEDKYEAR